MGFFNKVVGEVAGDSSKVLSVGQCGMDHGMISSVFKSRLNAVVTGAGSFDQATKALGSGTFDLVLINRILDADGTSGIDWIRRIKSDPALSETPVMLVSNYPEAQRAAEALGSLTGFGKGDLRSEEVIERLRAVLHRAS